MNLTLIIIIYISLCCFATRVPVCCVLFAAASMLTYPQKKRALKPPVEVTAASEAMIPVSHFIVKRKKSFRDGDMAKEVFLWQLTHHYPNLKTKQKYCL